MEQLDGKFPAEFQPLVADRKGDLLMLQDKAAQAKAEYEKAYKGLDERSEYRRLVEIKLAVHGCGPAIVGRCHAGWNGCEGRGRQEMMRYHMWLADGWSGVLWRGCACTAVAPARGPR